MIKQHFEHGLSRERGAATLVVVMVLFFVVSMVAAYTSRNLVFEQRTSTNQYRSTMALEAADAGLQWAVGLLNSGRISATCQASANLADDTFRQRYLSIDSTTGLVTPKVAPTGGGPLLPSCVFNGANWVCDCPADGAPAVATPAGNAIYPAFRVRFVPFAGKPGIVRIDVNGCTRNADACLNFPATGTDNEGRSGISALVALKGAVTTLPAAPLTARGTVNLGGAALTAVNSSPASTGLTIHAGGAVSTGGLILTSTPGSPVALSVLDGDTSLSSLNSARMFANVFGMWSQTYFEQPGAVTLNCGGGGCDAATVRNAVAQNPGRVIWLAGDGNLDTAGDVGSAAEPVALVATGNVTIAAGVNVFGLVYSQAATWATSGAGRVTGAVVAEGNLSGNSTATFVYDDAVLNRLRLTSGSFVIVPGSWKDF